ncbi:MAG TPA: hypothetical protein VMF52_17275 [Steroidobacteraceae bacterium]|nr:hypothetical protein [Steroidobacteraceae bacterium]
MKRRAATPPPRPTFWRNVRIAFLLLALGIAAYSNWYDRLSTTDWDETLWIGVFPIDADGNPGTASWLAKLDAGDIADIERFLNDEAHRHGVTLARPVRVDLYPVVSEKPPAVEPDAGLLSRAVASLKLRLYARRNSHPAGRPPPQIRIFVLFHDPAFTQAVPHSVGLQKGLVGVVHAFAENGMTPQNNVVIAHEILHTLGATDKYDFATLEPLYPIGYAEPGRQPLLPQPLTEIMAGRRAVARGDFEMPDSLRDVVVGQATATEIRWPDP